MVADHSITLTPGSPAFEALWEALAQYVENTSMIEEDLNSRQREVLHAARVWLELCDMLHASLAEDR